MSGQQVNSCHSGPFAGTGYADNAAMAQNQIKRFRLERNLSVEALADLAGMSQSYLTRIENGRRGLSVDYAEKLAMALGKTVPEVMGLSGSPQRSTIQVGLSEDVEHYEPPAGSLLARALKKGDNTYTYVVKTPVLSAIDIHVGDILIVDVSSEAVDNLTAQQVVVAQVYDPDPQILQATTVIRQFIPPALLITNSRGENELPLIRDVDAVIKGVVTDIQRKLRS